jgi:hypothetical protein
LPDEVSRVRCGSVGRELTIFSEKTSTALVSDPLSLAPALSSKSIFAPSTDVKLKHGILGLLKHIAQSANLSPIIPKALAESHVVERINESEIWDEGADQMAIILQLNAIGVVKHLCNADRESDPYHFRFPN